MDRLYDDVPRYRKKSPRKPPQKAKHRHVFEPCVVSYPSEWWKKEHERSDERTVEISAYCPICGKIGDIDRNRWWETPATPWLSTCGFANRVIPTDECERELNPATRTLPTFSLSAPFQKYVEVNNKIGV